MRARRAPLPRIALVKISGLLGIRVCLVGNTVPVKISSLCQRTSAEKVVTLAGSSSWPDGENSPRLFSVLFQMKNIDAIVQGSHPRFPMSKST